MGNLTVVFGLPGDNAPRKPSETAGENPMLARNRVPGKRSSKLTKIYPLKDDEKSFICQGTLNIKSIIAERITKRTEGEPVFRTRLVKIMGSIMRMLEVTVLSVLQLFFQSCRRESFQFLRNA